MNKFLAGPLITLGAIIVCLILGEAAARLFLPRAQTVEFRNVQPFEPKVRAPLAVEQQSGIDSVFYWGHQGVRLNPNIRAVIRGHSLSKRDINIDVNSLGLRYSELGPKQPGEFRVLVLGDSITIGDYVQAEETYPGYLEAIAKADGRHIRFINAGLPGANLSAEIYHYMEIKDFVDADVVLIGLYLNDSHDNNIFYVHSLPYQLSRSRLLSWLATQIGFLRLRLWQDLAIPQDIDESWKETFRAGRDLRSGDMFNNRDAMDFEVYHAYSNFGLAWNPKSWEKIETQLAAFKQELEHSGQQLFVALFPVHFQVKASFEDFRPQKYFTSMCGRLNLPCLDLLPDLRSAWKQSQEELYYDHCHLRPKGNEIVARSLHDWLARLGIILGSG